LSDVAGKLRSFSRSRRPLPLLYVEFSHDERARRTRVRSLHAAYKQATAAALKSSVGSILRRGDLVAAGAGRQWFVALLTARAPERKTFVSDADLGVAAERLRQAVQRSLAQVQSERGNHEARPRVTVRCGWNVLEPVDPKRPLEALRHAVRGAAVVARVEESRAGVLAAITHELRTPLTSIIGFADRLSSATLTNRARKRYLDIITEESNRLYRLTEGLIDIGAGLSGNLQLRMETHDLELLVQRAIEAVADVATRKKIAIRVSGGAAVVCDRDRFLQVLINLLDNAVRHSPERSRIDVSIQKSGKLCKLTVSDRGPGFAPSMRRAVWRPFERGPDGKVGLGLAISRILVEGHGGKVEIGGARSGGRVSVTLPAGRRRA
jgi:signal transduction histidine kinase